ncbi:MAG: radical SAM protein [Clostridia bacterium]
MIELLNKCELCPHKCNVNRLKNKLGFCRANDKVKIALASLHYFEEPCISGKNGSGTIFFSNCNMKCVYCQNFKISQCDFGKEITIEHLAEIFLKQQQKGANNINLVSPTIYVPQIIEAIKIAKSNGLKLKIIYNSSGYDTVETIKLLNGYIDIYLPDFKYSDDILALKYSKISNYLENAKSSIKEMYNQVGNPIFDDNGIIQKGLIVRHMILPNNIFNSLNVLNELNDLLGNKIYISIMAQYFPTYLAKDIKEINRKVTKNELQTIENFMNYLKFENGYIQELGEHEEEYVPIFDLSE